MTNAKLWTKDFLIDSTVNFFIYLVFYLFMVIIVSHVMKDMGGSASIAGLVFGVFVIGLLISRIVSGSLINRVGDKRMLYIGLIVFLLTTLLYFAAKNIPLLLFVRFINGIGMGIATTATGTIIAKIIPPERRGEGTGYFALTMPVASAIGSSLGIYISHSGSFNTILILSVFLLLISFVGAFFIHASEHKFTTAQTETKKRFSVSSFYEVSILPISIICVFIGISYSSILSFMDSYTGSINQVKAGSIFFIVYAFFILLSRPFTGKLFDRKGENFVMYPAFALFAAGLIVLATAENAFMIYLAAALVGFGYGTFTSSAQAIAIKEAPLERMGIATSTFYASLDAGVGTGPLVLGLLIPVTGYRPLYAVLAFVVVGCIFLYYKLYGKKISEKKRRAAGI